MSDLRRTGNNGYDIKHITDHQLEVVRRLALGERPADISRDLGLTPQTVSNIRNHPTVQGMIAALHTKRDAQTADIAEQIARVAPKAIALLENVIGYAFIDPEKVDESSPVPTNVPDSADQIRAALGIVKTVAPRVNLHKHLITSEVIERIKKNALEGAEEVEYEEVTGETVE